MKTRRPKPDSARDPRGATPRARFRATIRKPTPRVAKRGLYERFRAATVALGWRRSGERLLLALSGGRDSMALLHLLLVSGHRPVAAHFNHRLRGRAAEADARWVRGLCRAWHVPLARGTADVPSLARKHRLGLEEAARIARYRFLHSAAVRRRLRTVATAHHLGDQAETVLLRVLLGTAHPGAFGMRASRPLPPLAWPGGLRPRGGGLRLVRPLLAAPPGEIAAYVRRQRIPFLEDASNRVLAHPRNWLRHRLLPLAARRLNRNLLKSLARLAAR
ncbi:MAG: tRNA lysidine(34) synthetase TilS [Verrucomicrobiae bacterium]|nr:tRNA lysidine(34) synthetase TilS [Verrucomicrobiae bacterium]